MEVASKGRKEDHGLRARTIRLLQSRRAARWFHVLALSAVAQFLSYLAAGFIVGSIATIRHVHPFAEFPDADARQALLLSVLAAAAFVIIAHWKVPDLEPPKERLPRREWQRFANVMGLMVALGVVWIALELYVVVFSVVPSTFGTRLPTWSATVLPWLPLAAFLVLGLWAFLATRNQQLEMFETAQPPELRLVVNLRRHADAFRERAKALESAMEEAAAISEQVQHGIELERQQLSEVHEQYLKQARLMELTHEQQLAVADLLSQQQARSSRRALLSNIMVGFVFYLAGVVTPALINTNALRDQLQQWLHFG